MFPRSRWRGSSSRARAIARRVAIVGFASVVGLLVAIPMARAAELTEADVIELARQRAPGAILAEATLDLAAARDIAPVATNPMVGWDREALVTGRPSSQDFFRATLPIDVANPLTRRALTRSSNGQLRVDAASDRTQAIQAAVLAFYEILVAQAQVGVLEEALASLDEATRVLAAREATGEASGYETTRVSLERELARSRAAQARAEMAAAQARLRRVLALDDTKLEVRGQLLTVAPAQLEVVLARALEEHAVVQQAQQAVSVAERARAVAKWTWMPTLSVSAGAQIAQQIAVQDDVRYGYVAGVALSLPVFSRGQDLRAEASAQRRVADARVTAVRQQVLAQVAQSHAQLVALRQELERFDAATKDDVDTLLRAARAGYREGQRTLVELLDAQRTRTDVALRRLDLQAAAKRAEVRLRSAMGAWS